MGLSISYTLRAPAAWRPEELPRRLEAWAREIRRTRLGRPGRVTPVRPASSRFQSWITQLLNDTDHVGLHVEPRCGFAWVVEVGAGCEPLVLGLCRYPGRVELGGRVRTIRGGRQLHGFCKTEYAALQGVEHFVDCHRRVIAILRSAAEWGVAVEIDDEGGYWPGANERVLRERIGESQRAIAALAGSFKDAFDDPPGPGVQAPIFAHPAFERLEHEGTRRLFGGKSG